jgi:2,6-dihydroxypseudooxynicotine hydrolase
MEARRQALAADVVVVNHHLFFADVTLRDEGLAELLPACNTVILDEAHQLPDTATLFFGEQTSSSQLAELARDAEAAGRSVTAGDAWLRAAVAYHFAKFVWVLDEARVRPVHQRSVDALYAAHRRLGNAVERIDVPLDGAAMVGNLRRPDGAARPPLVILVPGLDSTKEELVPMEDAFLRRGMATFALDGPGQGEAVYALPLRHDYEVAVTATLDTLADRGDLDLERVGAVGQSMGGYFAPRAAAFEPRIRAVAAISGPFNFGALWDQLPELTRATFAHKARAADDDEARERALALAPQGPETFTAEVAWYLAARR